MLALAWTLSRNGSAVYQGKQGPRDRLTRAECRSTAWCPPATWAVQTPPIKHHVSHTFSGIQTASQNHLFPSPNMKEKEKAATHPPIQKILKLGHGQRMLLDRIVQRILDVHQPHSSKSPPINSIFFHLHPHPSSSYSPSS